VPLGAAVEWVVIAYLVCVASLLLTMGRLSDVVGRKRIWLFGLGAFTLGSMLCGAAPSLLGLILARAAQGIGGACMMAVSPAMLTGAFPPEQRGRAIGLNAVTVAVGISVGPTLGGMITERVSWRYIFYVNVPIGVLGLVACWKLLPRDVPRTRSGFDPVGAALLAVSLASLTALMTLGNELGWASPQAAVLALVVLVGSVLFALQERRHPYPVIDFSLFRSRLFSSACLSLMLSFWSSFAVSVLMPFYFEQLRGYGAERTGLMLTPFPLMIALIAPLAGSLADRIGTRVLASVGMSVLCLGLWLLSRLDETSTPLAIIGCLTVAGAGQALFQAPNNSALLGAAPPERQGLASGMLATGRTVGQSLSVALAGAIFAAMGGAAAGRALVAGSGIDRSALQHDFLHGYAITFAVQAGLAAIAAITSLARGNERGYRADSVPS
jgi:EmrB/QacA subfamily drug resistance transporter